MADAGGVWKTIHGTPVFIKDGQDVGEAIKERFAGSDSDGEGESGTFKGAKGAEIKWHRAQPKEFQDALLKAKESLDPEKGAWRVDSSHSLEDYEKDDCYILGDGSTVAVTKDGDIISVCKNAGDKVRGADLISFAVEHGGVKLDAYSGIYGFYLKCGFEPVSWTPWNGEYAPPGWKAGRDKEEHVIFYRYTGNRQEGKDSSEFTAKVAPNTGDNGYDDAAAARDNALGRK